MRTAIVLFILGFSLVSLNACKKGCTNPHAQNYSPSAKEDDASCRWCDSAILVSSTGGNYYIDYTYNSPYYEQDVLNVSASAAIYNYNGNACSNSALVRNCNGDVGVIIADATFRNLTSDTLLVYGTFDIEDPFNGQFHEIDLNGLEISPYATNYDYKNISMGCAFSSSLNIGVSSSNPSFSYR